MENDIREEYISKSDVIDIVCGQYCASSDETENALGEIIDAVKEHPPADVEEKRRWHDLRSDPDDLPEKQGTYLIVTNQGKVVSATYAPNFKKFNGSAGKSATHWQNTPEPPKE